MKGIIKIRAETSENLIKVAMSKFNKTKVVLRNINQDRSLATEIKGKKGVRGGVAEKNQNNKIRNENGDITTDNIAIQKVK